MIDWGSCYETTRSFCHFNVCCRNGNNEKMFKDVPYFCYSHLLALITVAPVTTTPAPVFDEQLLPPNPLYLDKVLSPADIVQARQLIALVSPDCG